MKLFFAIILSFISKYAYAQNCQTELIGSLSQLTEFNYGSSEVSNLQLNNRGNEATGTLSFLTSRGLITYEVNTFKCMIKSAKLTNTLGKPSSDNCLQEALEALIPFYTHNFNLSDDSPTLKFTRKVRKKSILIQHSFSQYATESDGSSGYVERVYNAVLDSKNCVIQSVQLVL